MYVDIVDTTMITNLIQCRDNVVFISPLPVKPAYIHFIVVSIMKNLFFIMKFNAKTLEIIFRVTLLEKEFV